MTKITSPGYRRTKKLLYCEDPEQATLRRRYAEMEPGRSLSDISPGRENCFLWSLCFIGDHNRMARRSMKSYFLLETS